MSADMGRMLDTTSMPRFDESGRLYRRYLLAVLAVFLGLSVVDRLALGLLLQSIKLSLHLSDVELGFLTGFAFAVFYSLVGLLIGRWADRGNRVTIISVTAALWSVLVGLCGFAASFVQLLLVRIGVAVGESGCVPAANSLIADYFPRAERPRAVAIFFTVGGSISAMVGYLVAGWVNEFYGWRVTFLVIGAPGMVLALVAWLTLKEPRTDKTGVGPVSRSALRGGEEGDSAALASDCSAKEAVVMLLRNATFRNLLLCFAITSFFTSGISQWQPAYFVRRYGLQTGELGTWFAFIYGIAGALGTYLGGELASRYAPNDERLQLRAGAAACSAFAIVSAFVYISWNAYIALGLMSLACLGGGILNGPAFGAILAVVPARTRAVAIATLYLFGNLIGLGLGPIAVGGMSDALRPVLGVDSLRIALLVMSPGYLWGAWHMWRASATVSRDVKMALDDETNDQREILA